MRQKDLGVRPTSSLNSRIGGNVVSAWTKELARRQLVKGLSVAVFFIGSIIAASPHAGAQWIFSTLSTRTRNN
jgi:hypothetical protein